MAPVTHSQGDPAFACCADAARRVSGRASALAVDRAIVDLYTTRRAAAAPIAPGKPRTIAVLRTASTGIPEVRPKVHSM